MIIHHYFNTCLKKLCLLSLFFENKNKTIELEGIYMKVHVCVEDENFEEFLLTPKQLWLTCKQFRKILKLTFCKSLFSWSNLPHPSLRAPGLYGVCVCARMWQNSVLLIPYPELCPASQVHTMAQLSPLS